MHKELTTLFLSNIEDSLINLAEIIHNCIQYFIVETTNKKLNININGENIDYNLVIDIKTLYTIMLSILHNIIIMLPPKSLLDINYSLNHNKLCFIFKNNGFKLNEGQFFQYTDFLKKNVDVWIIRAPFLLTIFAENNILYSLKNNNDLNIFTIEIPLYEMPTTIDNTSCKIYEFNPSFAN